MAKRIAFMVQSDKTNGPKESFSVATTSAALGLLARKTNSWCSPYVCTPTSPWCKCRFFCVLLAHFGSFWHTSQIWAHVHPKAMKSLEFGHLVIPCHSLHHFTLPDSQAIGKVRRFRPDGSLANEVQSLRMEQGVG